MKKFITPRFLLLTIGLGAVAFPLHAADTTISATTYPSGMTQTISSSEAILTSGSVVVANGANITFSATTSVRLGPGFHAENGSVFKTVLPVFIDSSPPTIPNSLTASAITLTGFTLTWAPSVDNMGVTGYEIFKNGVSVGTTTSTSLGLSGLTANTVYAMSVRARDAVPNWSVQSGPLLVATVLNPNGDDDGDGLTNVEEVFLGTNPATAATNDTTNTLQLNVHRPKE